MTDHVRRLAAVLFALLVVLTGCSTGNERPMKYLQTLPEDTLVYPGSTLTCTSSTPDKPFLDDPGTATSTHCYTADASESTVVAWYADELASRGWSRVDLYFGTKDAMPQWLKEFVALQMRRVNVGDDKDPNPTTFTMTLLATGYSNNRTPIAGLLALPEAALSYPGSTDPRDSESGRSTGSTRVRPARIERTYETSASVSEVENHIDRELLARGWHAVAPPTDFRFGWTAKLAWQKGEIIAGLSATPIKSGAITHYRLAIAEVLGPDQTPGLPWEKP